MAPGPLTVWQLFRMAYGAMTGYTLVAATILNLFRRPGDRIDADALNPFAAPATVEPVPLSVRELGHLLMRDAGSAG